MPAPDLHKLIRRIVADAADAQLDDAAFRVRAQRAAKQLQRALGEPPTPATKRKNAPVNRARPAKRSGRSAYRFIAVPNGTGGTTSVSVANTTFDELAQALGGNAQVTALARKVAASHKSDSGVSRSAYVLKRLRQRAARTAK